MRLVLVVALIGIADAAPPPAAPRASWADWVGEYSGKLAWTSCSVPGAAKATIAIDAIDGVLALDVARAADWLPALSLVEEEDGTLQAQQADLKIVLARAKPNTLDVAIDLASGCRARGRLGRAATASAPCDRLVAWARVEARCTKLHAPPLEPKLGKLERCEARADKLAAELVDAGCAPHPDPMIGVRARACVDLVDAAERLTRCARAPSQLAQGLANYAHGLASAAQTADTRATLSFVDRQCRDLRIEVDSTAAKFGCL